MPAPTTTMGSFSRMDILRKEIHPEAIRNRSGPLPRDAEAPRSAAPGAGVPPAGAYHAGGTGGAQGKSRSAPAPRPPHRAHPRHGRPGSPAAPAASPDKEPRQRAIRRSEEHTSELQSLMRTSYAVFRF